MNFERTIDRALQASAPKPRAAKYHGKCRRCREPMSAVNRPRGGVWLCGACRKAASKAAKAAEAKERARVRAEAAAARQEAAWAASACDKCHGSGRNPLLGSTCVRCHGSGKRSQAC